MIHTLLSILRLHEAPTYERQHGETERREVQAGKRGKGGKLREKGGRGENGVLD